MLEKVNNWYPTIDSVFGFFLRYVELWFNIDPCLAPPIHERLTTCLVSCEPFRSTLCFLQAIIFCRATVDKSDRQLTPLLWMPCRNKRKKKTMQKNVKPFTQRAVSPLLPSALQLAQEKYVILFFVGFVLNKEKLWKQGRTRLSDQKIKKNS